jgi:tryprostatin B 6-hydroxylase
MKTSESGIAFASEELASLTHLNGVINEALRLYPVVPTATYRKAPPEGISIGETFIPGGTDVWTPQYAIGRSEEIFPEPNRFLPERWYKYPNMVKDSTAFAPFLIGTCNYICSWLEWLLTWCSAGPYSCIGKPLALQNLRSTISKIVCTFDISFPPGEDASSFERGIRDRWVLGVPALQLLLSKRTV